jgi:hypothetical protein
MYRKYIFIIISPQKNYSSRDTIPLTRYSEDTVGSHSLQHPHPVQWYRYSSFASTISILYCLVRGAVRYLDRPPPFRRSVPEVLEQPRSASIG